MAKEIPKFLNLASKIKYKLQKFPPLVLILLLLAFLIYVSRSKTSVFSDGTKQQVTSHNIATLGNKGENNTCNIYNGTWVRNFEGTVYTNTTCKTIPEWNNCEKYGKDHDFVKWRWSPYGCKLSRFDPELFLGIVKGKTLAFVGDSVARNQMESLICLLSEVEEPINMHKGSEDKNAKWHFQSYNFTLLCLRTNFLVQSQERKINGSTTNVFNLHLDIIDPNWATKLSHTNYIVLSNGHWFFRGNYLYKQNKLIGCIFCSDEHIENLGPVFAIQHAFKTTLDYLNNFSGPDLQLVLVRTFSPAHFEHGAWNNGGTCNRTGPNLNSGPLSGTHLAIRDAQMEDIERMQNGGGVEFRAMDVTRVMEMRPDGHPGSHWNNIWVKGVSDCLHWCLPGPIDTWNEFLLETLKVI